MLIDSKFDVRQGIRVLRNHPRVELVDDERNVGNGVIITLKQGYSFDPLQDNRVSGADTITSALHMITSAHVYSGPFDK